MSTPDAKLSMNLNQLADLLHELLKDAAGVPSVPFVLICQPTLTAQYVSNCNRADGVELIKGLLTRWKQLDGDADLPEHVKVETVRKLIAACEAYHQALDLAFAILVQSTRGVEMEPFMPSQSRMWPAMVDGKAAVAEAHAALAFGKEVAERGTITVPPSNEQH